MGFKLGDKVKVIKTYDPNCSDVGVVGRIKEIKDAEEIGDAEKGYFLDIQHKCDEPYFYEDQMEIYNDIDEEEYKQAINNLMKENKELQEQLNYADKQLERQADTIDKLEDYAHELHDKLIEKMKGE